MVEGYTSDAYLRRFENTLGVAVSREPYLHPNIYSAYNVRLGTVSPSSSQAQAGECVFDHLDYGSRHRFICYCYPASAGGGSEMGRLVVDREPYGTETGRCLDFDRMQVLAGWGRIADPDDLIRVWGGVLQVVRDTGGSHLQLGPDERYARGLRIPMAASGFPMSIQDSFDIAIRISEVLGVCILDPAGKGRRREQP